MTSDNNREMNRRYKRRRKTDKGQQTKANKTKEQMSGNERKRAQFTFKKWRRLEENQAKVERCERQRT